MGAGSSQQSSVASHRLRKAIIIRTYNKSVSNETLDEYFRKFSYHKPSEDGASDKLCITMDSIKSSLDIDGKWADDLFLSAIKADKVIDEFYYSDFITFIECGKLPSDTKQPFLVSVTPRIVSSKKQQLHKHINESSSLSCDNTPRVNSKPFSKHMMAHTATVASSSSAPNLHTAIPSANYHPQSTDNDTGSYVSEPSSPCSPTPSTSTSSPSSAGGTDMVLAERKGLSILPPGRPLWRKREVVRQERTIEYTTIDVDGQLQELVEKETSETEVLHMECRETGEFAHRETTSYEQLETFNNEKVTEQKGFEEYVHLKSADDEYEYTESNMPTDRAKEGSSGTQGEPMLSPRVQQQEGMEGMAEQFCYDEDIDGAYNQQQQQQFDDDGSYVHGNTFNFDDLTEEEKLEVQAEMDRWRRIQEEDGEGGDDEYDEYDDHAYEQEGNHPAAAVDFIPQQQTAIDALDGKLCSVDEAMPEARFEDVD